MLQPFKQFCCGCRVTTGTCLILLVHFVAIVAYLAYAVKHFIVQQGASISGNENLQMFMVIFSLMGLPITGQAMAGLFRRLEQPLRYYLVYLGASLAVDVSLLIYGYLFQDPCKTAHHLVSSLADDSGKAFTCGIVRIGAYFAIAFVTLTYVYCLCTVWSCCEEIALGVEGPLLSDLIVGVESIASKHQLEPLKLRMKSKHYGTISADCENAIFGGSRHETSYPPPEDEY
eukprot:TRINITY_DN2475_c0_g2_i1.p1 TRINITY_DN2475_c0_g2~~TRINITY_DN2475_c0_g2_i1.p1  ORF type:complete len:230 (-),score=33.12 TRINITY_DN2475_c0_g2_i1:16-705(-)